jgi:phosphoribosylaminoimidazolecarboxamide formyltransferase/IMP cyclohydrolase
MDEKKITSALISVYDKEGIDEVATYLHSKGVVIYSTGGTQKHLEEIGVPVSSVESLTGFPEMLGGRVKTLHPMIFGGILNRRDDKKDKKTLPSTK